MDSVDYILVIFNCVRYRYKALKQKETWLKELTEKELTEKELTEKELEKNLIYFHVIGDPQLTNDYFFDNDDRILYIKVEDDYNSLPKKVIRAYNALKKTYNFKYILKTDDDQMVTNIKFFNVLMNLLDKKYDDPDNRIHYGGHIIDVKQPYLSQYYKIHDELPRELKILTTRYCTGRFYFLSLDAIDALIVKTDEIETEYLEDYAIGYNLPTELKTNMLQLDTEKYFMSFT
jgi:hypothetical protein